MNHFRLENVQLVSEYFNHLQSLYLKEYSFGIGFVEYCVTIESSNYHDWKVDADNVNFEDKTLEQLLLSDLEEGTTYNDEEIASKQGLLEQLDALRTNTDWLVHYLLNHNHQ